MPAARVLPYAPRHEYDYNPDASWNLPVATMLRTQISSKVDHDVISADMASLHAACTSAGDEPDPLLLQTDGLFSWRSKSKKNKTAVPSEVSQDDVSMHFTNKFTEAKTRMEWTGSENEIQRKYGIVMFENRSYYFQICYSNPSDDPRDFFLDVKVSPNDHNTTVLFNAYGPVDIAEWQEKRLVALHDFYYIKDPQQYFSENNRERQNKWPNNMPRKNIEEEALVWSRLRMQTRESLNPYVVQSCLADRALDPDASWQTDGRGWLPSFSWRSRRVAPVAQSTQVDPHNKNFNAMIRRRKPLNKPLTDDELLGEYTNVAHEFRNIQNNYYMDRNFKYAIPCREKLLDRPVYECFYKLGPQLIRCFCLGHPADHQGEFVKIKKNKFAVDIISNKEIPHDFKVPKNSPDVIWCIQSTRMIHASLSQQLHNLRNRKF